MKFNEVFEAFLAGKKLKRLNKGEMYFFTYRRLYPDRDFVLLERRYRAGLGECLSSISGCMVIESLDVSDLMADDWEVLDDA